MLINNKKTTYVNKSHLLEEALRISEISKDMQKIENLIDFSKKNIVKEKIKELIDAENLINYVLVNQSKYNCSPYLDKKKISGLFSKGLLMEGFNAKWIGGMIIQRRACYGNMGDIGLAVMANCGADENSIRYLELKN